MSDGTEQASKPKMLPLMVVAVLIIAGLAGIMLMNRFMEPDIDPNAVSAAVVIDYGNGTVEWYNVTTVNNSVPGMLDEAVGEDNYTLERNSMNGVFFLYSINGYGVPQQNESWENNEIGIEDLKSWQYYLDGQQAPNMTAAFEMKDQFALIHDGQTIRLAWEKPPFPSGIFTDIGISVTVQINYGNGTVISETVYTSNYTALGALEAAVGYENLDITDYGWGVLVDGINNVSTGSTVTGIDDTGNYYWLWYVNGDYAMVGASQYVLQDGDVMEWNFEESTW